MDSWIMWALGIVITIIIGILAFFIKRMITQNDERQKANETTMQQHMETIERNISHKIDRMQSAIETRIDRSEKRIETLEGRYVELLKEIPNNYVGREAWMLQSQTLDRKLDSIIKTLIGQGRDQ